MPVIHMFNFEDEYIFSYLNSILNTAFYKDIVTRNNIRDARILDRVVRYLFDNIGNITTAKKIADYFKPQKIKASVDTIMGTSKNRFHP